MLERLPAKEAHRRRQRRHRARQAAGTAIYPVELGCAVLQFLVRTHWVAEEDAGNRDRRGAAVKWCLHQGGAAP